MFPAIDPADVAALTACIDLVVERSCRADSRCTSTRCSPRHSTSSRRSTADHGRRPARLVRRRRGAATGALDYLLARPGRAGRRARSTPTRSSTSPRNVPRCGSTTTRSRHVRWPTNEFRIARFAGAPHDLVVLSGVEPHLRYAPSPTASSRWRPALGCEVVVTVGANAEAVPHTRLPQVVGSSTNDGLVRALGLGRPQYQGITGLVGVLQERLDEARIPAISLRVGVPHYLGNAQHPQSSAALLRHLEHVLGVPTGHAELDDEIDRWQSLHDEAVAEDAQAAAYVRCSSAESRPSRRGVAAVSGDDLAAELRSASSATRQARRRRQRTAAGLTVACTFETSQPPWTTVVTY